MNLHELTNQVIEKGYNEDNAKARVCQDIVLKAIRESKLSKSVTIKGGILMRNLTKNARRATQDIDIDFIRYSLSDEAIDNFIKEINCVNDILIRRTGEIEELSQQDYQGKRVFITISDKYGNNIESKIDLGVHNRLEISQNEYCFDIAFDNKTVSLLANSMEQMITEKIRSLLKFGVFSTRYKDIFDIYYLCDRVDVKEFIACMDSFVFNDTKMREKNMNDVIDRVSKTFMDETYKNLVDKSDKRWLDDNIDVVFNKILSFMSLAC